jgi:hypothetical protein
LALFDAKALADPSMDAIDGTGAMLAWPLVLMAAGLLTASA